MNDIIDQANHVAGESAMKAGSAITVLSALGTWLTDHADLVGVIAILIGTAIGIAGFVQNRRVVFARERREKIEHELRVQQLRAGSADD